MRSGLLRTRLTASLFTVALLAAACGGGDDAPLVSQLAVTPQSLDSSSGADPAATANVSLTPDSGSVGNAASAPASAAGSTPTAQSQVVARPRAAGPASIAATAVAIDSVDILASLEPAQPFADSGWKWSAQCAGQNVSGLNLPDAGMQFTDLGDEFGALRLGRVADPMAPSRTVLFVRANLADPLMSGAPRCEVATSPTAGGALPVGKPIWFALGIKLQKWVATSDEQILAQWHQGDGSIPLNPFLALSVAGDKVKVMLRYDASYPVSKATTTTIVASNANGLPADHWSYFVFKALISPDATKRPYLKVWRDGVPIVDYAGPFGYNYPEFKPYLKVGHYHWIDHTNPWPATSPTRTVLLRTPTLISDTAGRYTETAVRGYVAAR